MKKILVDMSATLIHHGHIRLLKKASKFGQVIVALTDDHEIKKHKNFTPELNFKFRKEILESIKYVNRVIKSPFYINEIFLKKNKIDLLVHGNDNKNIVPKNKILTFYRTKGISSTILRKKACKNQKKKLA
ncbi:adenylyltransferase/cytidyltransferase family protein [Candidatus Pelagibacter sp.]|nr:adenylyltransferase/cytidyltransferase family protein [Candidatus Pelagibacter sp.]